MTLESMIKFLFGLLLRTVVLLAGLLFFLSLLVVAFLLLTLWGLRALWARVTGRPVQPLAITILRRARWQRFYGSDTTRTPNDGAVIDVEARQVDARGADRLGR